MRYDALVLDVGRWGVRPLRDTEAAERNEKQRGGCGHLGCSEDLARLARRRNTATNSSSSSHLNNHRPHRHSPAAGLPPFASPLALFPSDGRLTALEVALVESVGHFMETVHTPSPS
jgi:hypothetical protein